MNKKNLIIPVLSGLLAAAWVILVYLPATEEINLLDSRYEELLNKQRNRVSPHEISLLRTRLDSLKTGLARRLESFYPEERLLQMGETLEQIGKQYNLTMISVTPDHQSLSLFTSDKAITELPVGVEYRGRFTDLTRYFDAMADFPIAFRLKRTDISKDPDQSGYLTILLEGVVVIKNDKNIDADTVG